MSHGLVFKNQAHDFTIAGEITEPAQRIAAVNGTFYSECKKP